ncbi:hypothetical protein ACLOJK_007453 [Asimina triloba]
MIPMLDLSKLFATHGADVTLVATPHDPAAFQKIIDKTRSYAPRIQTQLLQFPSADAELQSRSKTLESALSHDDVVGFISSMDMFREPLAHLVEQHRPDCIVSDVFFTWTCEVTTRFGIPRLVFDGSSYLTLCLAEVLERRRPHDGVASDSEPFVVPGLPHPIQLTRSQVPDYLKDHKGFFGLWERVRETNLKSFGYVMNSFDELERYFVEHYRAEKGRKAWAVGPLSLYNRSAADMAERGRKASIDPDECSRWLDAKQPGSVVYVCLGSMCRLSAGQLLEIAAALEASGTAFLWVVGDSNSRLPEQEWLPEELEKRAEGKGIIIRGWAPQVLILSHPAVGVFVTHCGWNSVLEGVSAGVAMVTWPIYAEQFYNEKLVTQVLGTGVPVGSVVWTSWENRDRPVIGREKIRKAIGMMMDGGDESERMKKRAKEMGEMALRAVEVGGSSYSNMRDLIKQLKMHGK